MTTNLTITLYGRYKDTAGTDTLTLTLPHTQTIQDVIDAFTTRYPEFTKDQHHMMITKNGTLTSHQTPLNPTDHIAIAPPVVSGG
jgi:molybdopterin converting factor small subunit